MEITIVDLQTKEKSIVSLSWVLYEINRDRSEDWTEYNENDWLEGWMEWCENNIYKIETIK